MSRFITATDYKASIHQDILESVTRSDKGIVKIAEDRAIEEMRFYLSARYDCDTIFSTTGAKRIQLVVMFCIDITLYRVFSAHNPQNISEIRVERYERAVEWLKGVQRGQINIEGAPLLEKAMDSTPYLIMSNPKRNTKR